MLKAVQKQVWESFKGVIAMLQLATSAAWLWLWSVPNSSTASARPGFLRGVVSFLEKPLVTWPIGILGGVLCLIFPASTYVCGGALLLAFHHHGALKRRSRIVQIAVFFVLFVALIFVSHRVNVAVSAAAEANMQKLAKYVAIQINQTSFRSPVLKPATAPTPATPLPIPPKLSHPNPPSLATDATPKPIRHHAASLLPSPTQIPPTPPDTQPLLLGMWRSKYKPKELTLKDLMYIDFGDSMRIALENLRAPGFEGIPVNIAVEINLERSDEIAIIYIPESEDTPSIMKYFAEHLLSPISFINQVKPWYKGPGDSNPMSGETVKFSGRVFIYHETPITQEDLFQVDALYKKQGMSVISRTMDYVVAQRNKRELERLSLNQENYK